jgi:hypothetical protein
MRAVMVGVLLPRGRSLPAASLAPPARTKLEGLFVSQQDQGDMKVDACDAACSMDHRIFGPPKPIVAFLYNCIIEARSGCA